MTYRHQLDVLLDRLPSYLPLQRAKKVQRLRLETIRHWLLALAAEDAEQRVFVEYLRAIAAGLCKRRPEGLFWQALTTLAPIAESGWWTRRSEAEVELDREERQLLRRVREDRRQWGAGLRWVVGAPVGLELLPVTLKALEICLRTGDRRGVRRCLELVREVRRTLGGLRLGRRSPPDWCGDA